MKVLLIDDEEKIVQSVKKGLEENGIAVDYAYDGLTGKLLAESGQYEVIISDIVMPLVNGLDLVKSLRQSGVTTPIILLTALNAVHEKIQGFDSGADDYLSKPFAFAELLARIRAISRRNLSTTKNAHVLRYSDLELNVDSKSVTRAGNRIELTPKEFSLLEYFLRNKERVISKAELAEKVWDIDFEINTNVVEVYISYLRNKVDKGFENKLIRTQFGVGYLLLDENKKTDADKE